jgi:prepilin-type N-terminal cleavage/methylation domain-containing protein
VVDIVYMMHFQLLSSSKPRGFSLIEAIFTIAMISIMSSLVVSSMTNASRDTSRILARQQQATLQSALTAWVMGNMRSTGGGNDGQVIGVEELRGLYNSQPNTLQRLNLVAPPDIPGYLDDATRDHFWQNSSNNNRIESTALKNSGQYLTLPIWTLGDFPKVMIADS